MNNEKHNMDDLLDDNLGRSLRQLGFIFPNTVADFKKIESQANNTKVVQPDCLKDPYSFLGKRIHKGTVKPLYEDEQGGYSQNLAQAARDGKGISEDVKMKMAEDKLKSNQKKNGH